jgi:hypothetical protein
LRERERERERERARERANESKRGEYLPRRVSDENCPGASHMLRHPRPCRGYCLTREARLEGMRLMWVRL